MKTKFQMTANDGEHKVQIEVKLDSSRYSLTREEVSRWKHELEDQIHKVLTDNNYHVNQIKLK